MYTHQPVQVKPQVYTNYYRTAQFTVPTITGNHHGVQVALMPQDEKQCVCAQNTCVTTIPLLQFDSPFTVVL